MCTAMQHHGQRMTVYKQGKNYHPQIYVEEFKYIDAESQQFNMLSDSEDEEFLEM